MENGYKIAESLASQSDISLINNIKDSNHEASLIELINRHSGIYHSMVNNFLSGPKNMGDKDSLLDEKIHEVYSCALKFDPTKNTKFPTYLANHTKWKCLGVLNKKKKRQEISFQDEEVFFEPYCDSFLETLSKEEVLETLSRFLEKEKDERIKKIIDKRYNVNNHKLTPWKIIAEELDMSIQGCINIHNKFLNKINKQTKYV
jgi:DNA-directed RNA polymerase specialized sigma subunit